MNQLPVYLKISQVVDLLSESQARATTVRWLESIHAIVEIGKRKDGKPMRRVSVDVIDRRAPQLADRLHMLKLCEEEGDE